MTNLNIRIRYSASCLHVVAAHHAANQTKNQSRFSGMKHLPEHLPRPCIWIDWCRPVMTMRVTRGIAWQIASAVSNTPASSVGCEVRR
ncbi:MAG: hypothetical protein U1F47_05515 [Hyphomicrobiales bacterium]